MAATSKLVLFAILNFDRLRSSWVLWYCKLILLLHISSWRENTLNTCVVWQGG